MGVGEASATQLAKDIPEIAERVSCDAVCRVIQHAEEFYVLDAALEFDLFERLKQPTSAHELAKIIGTDPKLTEKMCGVLVAMGLLRKRGHLYENSGLANAYLVEASPYCQKNLLRLERSMIKDRWTRFLEALRHGFVKVERNGYSAREFTLAMAESALRGELQRTVEALQQLEDMKRARKLLDLGGGHGLYAIVLAKVFPDLHAYVLDLPHVLEQVTREMVCRYEMGDRVHLIPADFTKEEIGSGYDVVFASHSLYGKSDQLLAILKKIHASLNNGGIFVSNHWYLDESRESPLRALLWELHLASFYFKGFDLFTLREFLWCLNKAGFVVEDMRDISHIDSPSKLVIARRL
ncbi:MAG: methyltransferase type 12 [Hadesarchaea archaeon]|nr:MAG: methyltransferase type 12 [Hadesarchaea archaeon]